MSFCYGGWRSVIISWPLMPKPVKPSSVEAPVPARRREADGAASVDRALQVLLAFREAIAA
jgi:hypothetical protein